MTVQAAKSHLRASIAKILEQKTPADFKEAGLRAAELFSSWLSEMPEKSIQNIALFHSMKDEIDMSFIEKIVVDLGATVFFPKKYKKKILKSQDFETRLGLHSTAQDMDLIVVPGRAFDRWGRRLGRGGGHYDLCLSPLSTLETGPILVGIALEEQIVDFVPSEAHDVAMHLILTPQELFKAGEHI